MGHEQRAQRGSSSRPGRQITSYPLTAGGTAPLSSRHIDIAGRLFDGLARFDLSLYQALAAVLEEEPARECDLAVLGPGAQHRHRQGAAVRSRSGGHRGLGVAITAAHRELMDATIRFRPVWPPAPHWGLIGTRAPARGFTFSAGDTYDTDERTVTFFYGCAVPKKPGDATFYILTGRDSDGQVLDGSATCQLTVPANVPARQYWAVTCYDLATSALITHSPRPGTDSYADLATSPGGSVGITFSSQPPDGNPANWVYVAPGKPSPPYSASTARTRPPRRQLALKRHPPPQRIRADRLKTRSRLPAQFWHHTAFSPGRSS